MNRHNYPTKGITIDLHADNIEDVMGKLANDMIGMIDSAVRSEMPLENLSSVITTRQLRTRLVDNPNGGKSLLILLRDLHTPGGQPILALNFYTKVIRRGRPRYLSADELFTRQVSVSDIIKILNRNTDGRSKIQRKLRSLQNRPNIIRGNENDNNDFDNDGFGDNNDFNNNDGEGEVHVSLIPPGVEDPFYYLVAEWSMGNEIGTDINEFGSGFPVELNLNRRRIRRKHDPFSCTVKLIGDSFVYAYQNHAVNGDFPYTAEEIGPDATPYFAIGVALAQRTLEYWDTVSNETARTTTDRMINGENMPPNNFYLCDKRSYYEHSKYGTNIFYGLYILAGIRSGLASMVMEFTSYDDLKSYSAATRQSAHIKRKFKAKVAPLEFNANNEAYIDIESARDVDFTIGSSQLAARDWIFTNGFEFFDSRQEHDNLVFNFLGCAYSTSGAHGRTIFAPRGISDLEEAVDAKNLYESSAFKTTKWRILSVYPDGDWEEDDARANRIRRGQNLRARHRRGGVIEPYPNEFISTSRGKRPSRDYMQSLLRKWIKGGPRRKCVVMVPPKKKIRVHVNKRTYWEMLITKEDNSVRANFSKGILNKMVFSPGECEDCFKRLLYCRCVVPSDNKDMFYCDEGIRPELAGEVNADNLVEVCKQACMFTGIPCLVIGVFVTKIEEDNANKKKKLQYKKDLSILYKDEGFYNSNIVKVIFVNYPSWSNSTPHAAMYKDNIGDMEEGYKRYLEVSRYNTIVYQITSSKIGFCPICGEMINDEDKKSHYFLHYGDYKCESCGFVFKTEDEWEEHCQYHCKCPKYKCTLSLSVTNTEYSERAKKGTVLNVYADLESAINEENEHINIMAAWIDDRTNKVGYSIKKTEEDGCIIGMFEQLYQEPEDRIQVFFHNGENYDFHFIIKELCEMGGDNIKDFELTCDSGEKVRYFSVKYKGKEFIFKDTFAYVSDSLEKWVKSTKESGCEFPSFKANMSEEKAKILLQKNPFPYNAIKSYEDLSLEFGHMFVWIFCDKAVYYFCDKYTIDQLVNEVAPFLREGFSVCKWGTIGDYYLDYLTCDVTQLKDCFEYFAHNMREQFGLECSEYFGTPSLSWAAWLKQNDFPLEPLPNFKAFDVVNSSIRGGQTGAMTRYYSAKDEPGSFVCDLDCNSLYPTVMLKYEYPCHDWHLEEDKELMDSLIEPSVMISYIEQMHKEKYAAFFEIDLEVVDDEKFYSYVPIANKEVFKGNVYNYQAMNDYCWFYGQKVSSVSFAGLANTMGRHNHYCCYSENLIWYLKTGVIKLLKVYKYVCGKCEPVFSNFVLNNLMKRKEYSKNPVLKMLYKLINNSLYGKTYEDVARRAVYKMIPKKEYDKLKEEEIYRKIEDYSDWVFYEGVKDEVVLNKPIYLGAVVTELSKLWMYKFFYDFIRVKFPNSEVLYTDTDALTIKFPAEYGITSMKDVADRLNTDDEQIIDTSNFVNPLMEERHNKHNNEPGLFKSETGEAGIVEMVALRAKSYIMLCSNGDIKMSLKGCPMKEKQFITMDDFKEVLWGYEKPKPRTFKAIRSISHRVYTQEITKIVLSADDRKRFIYDDKYHTAPLFSRVHLEQLNKVHFLPIFRPEELETSEEPLNLTGIEIKEELK